MPMPKITKETDVQTIYNEVVRLQRLLEQAETRAQAREQSAFHAGYYCCWDYDQLIPNLRFTADDYEEAQEADEAFRYWRQELEAEGIAASMEAGRET